MSADVRILVATPTAENHVTTHHAASLFRLAQDLQQRGQHCDHASLTWSDLEMARNVLASQALAQDFTHILFVDSDIGFRTQAVQRLLAANKSVVGAVYAQKNLDLLGLMDAAAAADRTQANWQRKLVSRHTRFNGVPFEKEGRPVLEAIDGIARYRMVGMGMTLIACDALRRMISKDVVKQQRHPIGAKGQDFPVYGFFNRLTDAEGNLVSEDFSFCLRWARCDGEVFALVDEPVFHIGAYTYVALMSETLMPGLDPTPTTSS